jgi:AAA ATPase domain
VPRRVSSPHLVGRGDALEAVAQALEQAAAGDPGLVIVAGEAGVGKTRLTREACARAEAAGARVLWRGCVPLDAGELPHAPLVAALRPLSRELSEAGDLLGPAREELNRLLPELGAAAPPAAPATRTSRTRLFELLLGVLGRLAEAVRGRARRRGRPLGRRGDPRPPALPGPQRRPRAAAAHRHAPHGRPGRPGHRPAGPPAAQRPGRAHRAGSAHARADRRAGRRHPRRRGGRRARRLGVRAQRGQSFHHRGGGRRPRGRRRRGGPRVAAGGAARPHRRAAARRTTGARGDGYRRRRGPPRAAGAGDGAGRARARRRAARAAARPRARPRRDGRALRVPPRAHARGAVRRAAVAGAPRPARGAGRRDRGDRARGGARRRGVGGARPPLGRRRRPPRALGAALAAADAAVRVYAFADARRQLERARELWPRVAPTDRPRDVDEAELLRRLADAARLAGDSDGAIPIAEAALAALDPPTRAARRGCTCSSASCTTRWHRRSPTRSGRSTSCRTSRPRTARPCSSASSAR